VGETQKKGWVIEGGIHTNVTKQKAEGPGATPLPDKEEWEGKPTKALPDVGNPNEKSIKEGGAPRRISTRTKKKGGWNQSELKRRSDPKNLQHNAERDKLGELAAPDVHKIGKSKRGGGAEGGTKRLGVRSKMRGVLEQGMEAKQEKDSRTNGPERNRLAGGWD